jgi:hypothetical protein
MLLGGKNEGSFFSLQFLKYFLRSIVRIMTVHIATLKKNILQITTDQIKA